MSYLNRIFLKSCESMDELPTGSVQLTVTSPPYWNSIDYDSHIEDSSAEYRGRKDVDYHREYIPFLERCFTEVFRVHSDGSFCAAIVGTVLYKHKHTPLPHDFTCLMQKIGWEFHQDIVWYKCTGGVKRAGSTIRNPYPGYYYPNLMTEYILIFRKPSSDGDTPRIFQSKSSEAKHADSYATDAVFKYDIANNIWHIAPVPPKQIDHPCAFPEEIPHRIIKLYSYKDDLVLDPFAGAGTTLKVAKHLGRNWVGYEITRKYVDMSLKRISEPFHLRKQLICRFEKIKYGEQLFPKNKPRAPFRLKKNKKTL